MLDGLVGDEAIHEDGVQRRVTSLGIAIDKSQVLKGAPTEYITIINGLRSDPAKWIPAVREELPDMAQVLFDEAGVKVE